MLKTVGNPNTRSGDQTIVNGNLVIGTAGKGIDFSADPSAAGMTSELFDDYEEGTFTPTVAGSGTAGTATYTAQIGRYTKIGRIVTCQVRLNWSAGNGVGNFTIAGLPFTAAAQGAYGGAAIGWAGDIALTANNVMTIYVGNGSSTLIVYQYPVGGGAMSNVPYDAAGNLTFTVTYETT